MPTSTPLQPTITMAGLAAIFNAQNTGVEFALTHIAFGTAQYTPDGSETALRVEKVRVPIAGGGRISPTQIQIYAVAMAALGNPFFVGEVGFFGNNGTTLLAVYSSTGTPSLYLSDTVSTSVSYGLSLAALPANTVTVTIDPSASAALLILGNHVAAADPHPQYVEKVNGVAFYDPTVTFNQGAETIGDDLLVYQSVQANNIGNTPSSSPAWWVPLFNYGNTPVTGLAAANVTLSSTQAARAHITLSGALTANIEVIFPNWIKEWIVLNKTTGAFSLTCQTAAGTGVAIPQNSSPTRIYGDGTNIVQVAENVGAATASPHPVQLGQLGALPNSQYVSTAGKLNGVNRPNLQFNGSAEFGVAGWTAVVGSGLVSGTDADGGGTFLTNGTALAGTSFACNSPPVTAPNVGDNVTLSLDGYAVGATAGNTYARLNFLDASLTSVGTSSNIVISNGANWTHGSVSAVVPAGAVFVCAEIVSDTAPTVSANGMRFRRIKIEAGATPSLYSQEASIAAIGGGLPVVGSVRNLVMSVTAAGATATLTADEIIVGTALGGFKYALGSFNKTINLATTGAGAMDTGAAPFSGFVALYAIYNPNAALSATNPALLAKNATSAVQPNVYGGTNMPAGYTASALVGVWPTNGSGQFPIGYQRDRHVSFSPLSALNSNTIQASYTSLYLGGVVPPNAIGVIATLQVLSNLVGTTQTLFFAGDANGTGAQTTGAACSVANNGVNTNGAIPIITAQTLYWKSTNIGGGTPTYSAAVAAYDF